MFERLTHRSRPVTANVAPAHLASFAAYLADRSGGALVDVGCSSADYFATKPESAYIGLGGQRYARYPNERFRPMFVERPVIKAAVGSVVLCHDVLERVEDPSRLLLALRSAQAHAEAVLVTAYDRDRSPGARWTLQQFESVLSASGLTPRHLGYATGQRGKDLALAVCRQPVDARRRVRVVAIMTAFNEADIIRVTIPRLIEQGIRVCVIDNWSTDETFRVAQECGASVERFPQDGPSKTYDWHALLTRVEEIAAKVEADWIVHHDADEVRMSPFEGTSLVQGIAIADAEGYNAIDFTVADFPPVDDSFETFGDLDRCFPGFVFGSRPGHFVQVKGWKKTGQRVNLADGGGHNATFDGRRVFPYKFFLRHYPVRSQAHGIRKILSERQQRWNPGERAKGWHHHYDSIAADHNFVREPADLTPYVSDSHFAREFLIERLSGVDIRRG